MKHLVSILAALSLAACAAAEPTAPKAIFVQSKDELELEARRLDDLFRLIHPGENIVLTAGSISKEGNEKLASLNNSLNERISIYKCIRFRPAEVTLRGAAGNIANPTCTIVGGVLSWDEAVIQKIRGWSLQTLILAWANKYAQTDTNFEVEGEVATVRVGLQVVGPDGFLVPRKSVSCTAQLVREKKSSRFALLVWGSGPGLLKTVAITTGKQEAANLAIAKCVFYLVGKLGAVPYWKVETNGERDPDVEEAMSEEFSGYTREAQIRCLQQLLVANHYPAPITGEWDRVTETLLRSFAVGNQLQITDEAVLSPGLYVALQNAASVPLPSLKTSAVIIVELRGAQRDFLQAAMTGIWNDPQVGVTAIRPLGPQQPQFYRITLTGEPQRLQAAFAASVAAAERPAQFVWTDTTVEGAPCRKLVAILD